MNKYIKKNEDQELIREILGKNKYLMLNLSLVSMYGVEVACMLVYILDKIEYAINIKKDALDTGVVIFRKDFENLFKISPFKQRKNENILIEDGILSVYVQQNELTTYNFYKVNLEMLYHKMETNTPSKN
jgi:hypothetical protein